MNATTFHIENGIPLPEKQQGKWRDIAKALKPGQSVKVETNDERKAILRRAKLLSIPLTSRKVDGDGFRIWRLAAWPEKRKTS